MELDLNIIWPMAAAGVLAWFLEKGPRQAVSWFRKLEPAQKQRANQILIVAFSATYQLFRVCNLDGCAVETLGDVIQPLLELVAAFFLSLGVNQGVYYGVKPKGGSGKQANAGGETN